MGANTVLKLTTINLFLLVSVFTPITPVQNALALTPVTEITSADSEGQKITDSTWLKLQPGDNTRTVKFDYRGFDDNNHIIELRCSFDGINYAKSNCSLESEESQATLIGSDGISRTYFVKTGTTSRELPPSAKTYTFGVKVLNDNGELSPAVIRTFKVLTILSSGPGNPNQAPPPPPAEVVDRTIKVRFDSITINDDHDHYGLTSIACCSGEWTLAAYVQGNAVPLLQARGDVDDGDTFQFGSEREVVFNLLKDQSQAISIMTLGFEDDIDVSPIGGFCAGGYDETGIKAILHNEPPRNWRQAIHAYQVADDPCSKAGDVDKIGYINEIFSGGKFDAGEHNVKSENGDFNLKFTISVEPYVPKPVSQDHHKVKVNFDSITVHSNHEDSFNGNGEYHPFVFVHGMGIDLAQATEFGVCGGSPTHCGGLWNVKSGQSITFKPDTSITVDLPATTPLSIFTIGEEVDSCGADFHNFLPDIRILQKYPGWFFTFFNDPYDWGVAKEKIAQFQKSVAGLAECIFANDDEVLGTINELYDGPDYQAGPHEVISSSGDFTLRYTVSAEPTQTNMPRQIPDIITKGPILSSDSGLSINQGNKTNASSTQHQQLIPLLKSNQKNDSVKQQQLVPLLKENETNDSVKQQQSSPSLNTKPNEATTDSKKTETNPNADSTTEPETANISCTFMGDNFCNGTDGNDVMSGDDEKNYMNGLKGNDIMYGNGQNDNMLGGEGNDKIDGGEDNEYSIDGGEGDDILNGGNGDDNIFGGKGGDSINGGAGNDKIFHNILGIHAGDSDESSDLIDCGPGYDEVWINVLTDNDKSANCEAIHSGGDSDNDRKSDQIDNCKAVYNPDQKDFDDDKIGDQCDPDDDNDKVGDVRDNCRYRFNPEQEDSDHDRKGDACDIGAAETIQ